MDNKNENPNQYTLTFNTDHNLLYPSQILRKEIHNPSPESGFLKIPKAIQHFLSWEHELQSSLASFLTFNPTRDRIGNPTMLPHCNRWQTQRNIKLSLSKKLSLSRSIYMWVLYLCHGTDYLHVCTVVPSCITTRPCPFVPHFLNPFRMKQHLRSLIEIEFLYMENAQMAPH